jgi:RNA polymerase sigma-70 factor (ECF subfamily)
MDTEDLVQEAAANAFRRLRVIEPRRRRALQSYLQESIKNRIRDEVRRAGRVEVPESAGAEVLADESSPLEHTLSVERRDRYRAALMKLASDDQSLIVGRLELGMSYEQIALATNRPSPDAARVAIRRAMLRLAEEIEPE